VVCAYTKGVRVFSPLLRPESINPAEQGLTWELAILAAPCPELPCPKHSNLVHQTGIGPADSGIQDSVPWGFAVRTAGPHNLVDRPCSMLDPDCHHCFQKEQQEQDLTSATMSVDV
jgi:hypothetical protein